MAATILVIDSYEIVRRALCLWLKIEFPSIQIIEAGNYAEAMACIRIQLPNLVIIDILLPGTNGIRATEQISSLLPRVPIVILTMYEDEEYRDEALQAGATLFIPKREMYKELIPNIQALLASIKTLS